MNFYFDFFFFLFKVGNMKYAVLKRMKEQGKPLPKPRSMVVPPQGQAGSSYPRIHRIQPKNVQIKKEILEPSSTQVSDYTI